MAEFGPAFEHTMKFEDDPHEPGRVSREPSGCRARFGINEDAHPDMDEDFWTEPAEDAKPKAEAVYESDYWRALNCDAIEDQAVANKLFDMAVNMGDRQAVIYLQRGINFLLQESHTQAIAESPDTPRTQISVDGNLGPKTLEQLNALDPAAIVQELRNWSATHYQHVATHNPKFAGWLEGSLKRAMA